MTITPPSEKQLALLANANIRNALSMTREEATEVIKRLPATTKQLLFIHELGFPLEEIGIDRATLTIEEANAIINVAKCLPSPKQWKLLIENGIPVSPATTRTEATVLISRLAATRPATAAQLKRIRSIGFRGCTDHLTVKTASDLISSLTN